MDDELTHQYAANVSALAAKARSVIRDLDPQNDLTFLRIRSKKHEIMIAPGPLHLTAHPPLRHCDASHLIADVGCSPSPHCVLR